MNDYLPGAVQVPQPNGGWLNAALPPRAVWHITWDKLDGNGGRPSFGAVSGYLQRVGYCPTLMWDPFSGYVEQYYPASESARALVAWNEDGAACVQIEVLFSPGCVVDGVRYETVAGTPCVGLGGILDWLDSLGIPRAWPMGAPGWQGNSRDVEVWNANGGHYGHCNVPDNTHTDPGPMPALSAAPAAPPVTTVPAPAPAAPSPSQCVVEAGDTLSGIAAQFGVDLGELIRVNGITEPDRIFPGMVLDLPGEAVTQCIVEPGDTLSGIAAQFGVSLDRLVAVNPGIDPDLIHPGQVLNL